MKTKVVRLGKLKIGGNHPIVIKGMIKTSYNQPARVIAEAKGLMVSGAQAIRLAVRETNDVRFAQLLKNNKVDVPLVADIHFDARLALAAIEAGFDGIRLNPLNITNRAQVHEIARLAKHNRIPIRVGINSGGFRRTFSNDQQQAIAMVKAVGQYISWLRQVNFSDIMVSLKGADVATTIKANRLFAAKFNYPLHLGVTATGQTELAVVKSAIGIGSLLALDIGNIIRVSLTQSSQNEIILARLILQALNLGNFGPEVISCPTCSRCQVNLKKISQTLNQRIQTLNLKQPIKIAAMGCVVNGPGEAIQADIGAAFGAKKAVIFKKGKIIKTSPESQVLNELVSAIKKEWR